MAWHFKSFVNNKPISQEHWAATKEAIEDFVNNLHPEPSQCHIAISEGGTQRAIYCWVEDGDFNGAYDYETIIWESADNTGSQVQQLLENGQAHMIIGFDSGRTQSLHYLRSR